MKLHFKMIIRVDLTPYTRAFVTINDKQIGNQFVTEKQAAEWIAENLLGRYSVFPRCPRPYPFACEVDAGITKQSRQTYYVTLNGSVVGSGFRSLKGAKAAFLDFYGERFTGTLSGEEIDPLDDYGTE